MAELSAEVRVVVHATDRPAVFMDCGDVVVDVGGNREVALYLPAEHAQQWLAEIAATVAEVLEVEERRAG